jgi:peptidoglycan/xylan/chitin deacetylase (PgdA/CDA1 family)
MGPAVVHRATVLAYHAVGPCPPEDDPNYLYVSEALFATHMALLARARTVVTLGSLVDGVMAEGPPAVAITFDDGYRSVLTTAAPVLAHFGFPATVFLPTAFVGASNTWDPPSPCGLPIMDAGELRALRDMGIEVESHGHRHIDFARASEEEIRADLETSLAEIEQVTGRRPRFLAYPYGATSPEACRAAAEMGFDAGFSIAVPHAGTYQWARTPINRRDGLSMFRLKTGGDYLRLRHSRPGRIATRLARMVRTGAARIR